MTPRQDFKEEWAGYCGELSPQGHIDFNSYIKTRSLSEREDRQAEEEYSSEDIAIKR